MQGKSNWTDSDELALMFRNTYQLAFYKQLHRYVHKKYLKEMALQNFFFILKKPLKANRKILKRALSGIYLAPSAYLAKIKLQQLRRL